MPSFSMVAYLAVCNHTQRKYEDQKEYIKSWDCVKVKITQSCMTLCNPMDYTVHGILLARILEWVSFPFSRASSQPRDQIQVSHIAGGFFTSWVQGKPKNTGVGSLCLFQWIFLTQKLSWGLIHCRWILYQLSYQGSPVLTFYID